MAKSYVAAAAIGHWGFGEPIGPTHLAAIGFISVGVALLATA